MATIGRNYIESYFKSINLLLNDGATGISIFDNQIKVNPDLLHPSGGNGINISEGGVTNNIGISNNIIDVYYGACGIFWVNPVNEVIKNNTIEMHVNSMNSKGIELDGSLNQNNPINVSCNDILNTTYNISANSINAGIYSLQCTANISCNTFHNSHDGVMFSGNCEKTIFEGNTFYDHFTGLHLTGTAVTGKQINTGNRWDGVYGGTPNQGARHDAHSGTFVDNSQFLIYPYVNPYQPQSSPYVPRIGSTTLNWILAANSTDPLFDCTSNAICGNSSTDPNGDIDRIIASGNFNPELYSDASKWLAEKELFERLFDNPSLRNNDILLQDFYNLHSNGSLEQFAELKDSKEMLYAMQASLKNLIEQNQLSIDNLKELVINSIKLKESETQTEQQILLLNNDIEQYLSQISNLELQNKTSMTALESDRTSLALSAFNDVNGIVTNEVYEQNEKEMIQLYMATVAIDNFNFTETQIATLKSIAEQCVFTGGKAVFIARAIYAYIDEAKEYDDQLICAANGIALREAPKPEESLSQTNILTDFSLSPNPASTFVTLNYSISNQNDYFLRIFDQVGRQVNLLQINPSTKEMQVDISNLGKGVYLCKVFQDKSTIWNQKLVIIK